MTTTIEAPELIKQVESIGKPASRGYQAQITLLNNCPSNWGVVIVSAGVKFFYRDGTDYTDGPRTVNLYSGQSATFVSNDANKCVFQYFVAMVVDIPNEGAKTMTFQDGVGAGECVVHCTVTLGPKQSVSQSALSTHRVSDLLVVAKRS